MSLTTLVEYLGYFTTTKPEDWKEIGFLLWLDKNENLFKESRSLLGRKFNWHNQFLKALEDLNLHCKSFLCKFKNTLTAEEQIYAKRAISKSASLRKQLVKIPKNVSEWWAGQELVQEV
ncbi:hypothetical protein F8M41_023854 [Gigaspora margarita]|uniref:Uncharacterized protein n=1 Tax=Gigaspora margarita TaxID=4874 RepID=A0A8H4B0N9_GIGMA|nr:hypothetical protein F8M41_023854 [Gigaspora margarita]